MMIRYDVKKIWPWGYISFKLLGGADEVPGWIPKTILTDPDCKSQLRHMFKMFNGLQRLQQDKTLCDITIQVGNRSFEAHRAILAACSDYFAAMLTSGFQESHESEAIINGKPEAFQVLLDFAYSGKLCLSSQNVIDVLEMAHYLQFDIVTERCEAFLNDALSQPNAAEFDVEACIKIITTADLLEMQEVKKKCEDYLAENFKTTEAFLLYMTADLMKELLERTDLKDEKEVSLLYYFDLCW